jgi:hypothetical protein
MSHLDKLVNGGIRMGRTFEKNLLRALAVFGVVAFANLMRKPPVKDWMIIFFLKGYISSILDKLVVRKGYVRYPVQLNKSFDISFIFDYLLFPISCVYFNQVTSKCNSIGIILRLQLFAIPMTLVETWLEKNTKVVSYHKGWNWKMTYASLSTTFLFVRMIIAIIRKGAEKSKVKQ